MNLKCLAEIAGAYRSGSRIAGAVTEEWCAREMYCPACDCDRLTQSRTNTPVFDFVCPQRGQFFQLKSSKNWNPRKIVDAGYEAMIRAIRADKTPNLLVLHYSPEWAVANLLLVPRMFFTESIIEKRKPLSTTARRSGWVGCNILLREIPQDGKISVVSYGAALAPHVVRAEFSRVRDLSQVPPKMRGWTADLLKIIRRLEKPRFTLAEVYAFESELRASHPQNRHIRPKIRQQLQVLRDLGLVSFDEPGKYRIR